MSCLLDECRCFAYHGSLSNLASSQTAIESVAFSKVAPFLSPLPSLASSSWVCNINSGFELYLFKSGDSVTLFCFFPPISCM